MDGLLIDTEAVYIEAYHAAAKAIGTTMSMELCHAMIGVPTRTGYSAAKHAMRGFFDSLRIELEKQGTLVTGVHLGFTETDMTTGFDVPKNDPRDVARQIVDAIEHGDAEVLADDMTRHYKSALSGPVEALRAS